MTEQKTYECNRCGKTFYGQADWEVPVFTLDIYYGGSRKADPDTNHLCQDCEDSYNEFFRAWKQFDALAKKTLEEVPIER